MATPPSKDQLARRDWRVQEWSRAI